MKVLVKGRGKQQRRCTIIQIVHRNSKIFSHQPTTQGEIICIQLLNQTRIGVVLIFPMEFFWSKIGSVHCVELQTLMVALA